jgi:hypothetical protein
VLEGLRRERWLGLRSRFRSSNSECSDARESNEVREEFRWDGLR